jgi:hypothetical protein
MKNKPNSKLSINDLVNGDQTNKAPNPVKSFNDNLKKEFAFNEEFAQELVDYNDNILNINGEYESIECRFKVLVRVFTKTLVKDENGLIVPNTIMLPIPTQNGVGNYGFVESPWPYSNRAVVIAAPNESTLSKGDIILLDKDPVTGIIGTGKNVMLKIPNSFVHPNHVDKYFGGVPTDPKDPNYGFLLVNDYDIILKFKQ